MAHTFHDVAAQHRAGAAVTTLLPGSRAPRGERLRTVASLPFVIREPQWVSFAGERYRLSREGIYRFWDWGRVRQARPNEVPTILSAKRTYSSVVLYRGELVTLLASLASVHVHGYAHQAMSFAGQLRQAKRGLLSLTCGPAAGFFVRLLGSLGMEARAVGCHRLAGRLNTFDNGHSLVEVFWPRQRKWVLADPDLHCMFRSGGRWLDLREASEVVRGRGRLDLVPLTGERGGLIDTTDAVAGRFSGLTGLEGVAASPDLLEGWYRAMLEVPLQPADGFMNYPALPKWKRVFGDLYPSYRAMAEAEWTRRFYGVARR